MGIAQSNRAWLVVVYSSRESHSCYPDSRLACSNSCSAALDQFLNAGSFFGRIFSGPSAERFGAIETFAFCGIASGVVILGLWTTTAVGTAGTVIGALLYGFFSGKSIREHDSLAHTLKEI